MASGINQRHSTTYYPQTQGQVESKWLETYLWTFCNHWQSDWADLLHMEFAHNNHFHPSIGMSPVMANYEYDMSLTGTPHPWWVNTPL
jgi:transposase InsO family protein